MNQKLWEIVQEFASGIQVSSAKLAVAGASLDSEVYSVLEETVGHQKVENNSPIEWA
ncbi:hypothetical protein [Sporolactobacillus laevolacticus]|uniref:hypothetical protein n=1 Tax=Sporolactobacillus laevolacticus TaxID=33018 RepID=UPI0025B40911|nr:hypothetical protein [Sporolactobacillus laevolacticus]MDN3956087.1 hypothetical protein [Sporolactobacillus laevolacticus]